MSGWPRESSFAERRATPQRIVLDTNVLVAACFNRSSASAHLVDQIRDGQLRLVWDEATREESEHILRKIPPLSWEAVADLYQAAFQYHGPTDPGAFRFVPDADDRKFAALAAATDATLLTMDAHLLSQQHRMEIAIQTPAAFVEAIG